MKFFNLYLRAPILAYCALFVPIVIFAIVGFFVNSFSVGHFLHWLAIGALFLLVSLGASVFFVVPASALNVAPGGQIFEISLAPLAFVFVIAVWAFFSGRRAVRARKCDGDVRWFAKENRHDLWQLCASGAVQGLAFAGFVLLCALLFVYLAGDLIVNFGIKINYLTAVFLSFLLWFLAFAIGCLYCMTADRAISSSSSRQIVNWQILPCVRFAILRLFGFGVFGACVSCVVIVVMLFANFVPSLEPSFIFFDNTGAMLVYLFVQMFFVPNIVLYAGSILLGSEPVWGAVSSFFSFIPAWFGADAALSAHQGPAVGALLGNFDRLLSIFYFVPVLQREDKISASNFEFYHYFWLLFLIFAFVLAYRLAPKITASTFVRKGQAVHYFFSCILISLLSAVMCAAAWIFLMIFATGRLGFVSAAENIVGSGVIGANFVLSFFVVFLYLFVSGIAAALVLFARIWVYKKYIMYAYF